LNQEEKWNKEENDQKSEKDEKPLQECHHKQLSITEKKIELFIGIQTSIQREISVHSVE
jgi:hypothetical protein